MRGEKSPLTSSCYHFFFKRPYPLFNIFLSSLDSVGYFCLVHGLELVGTIYYMSVKEGWWYAERRRFEIVCLNLMNCHLISLLLRIMYTIFDADQNFYSNRS